MVSLARDMPAQLRGPSLKGMNLFTGFEPSSFLLPQTGLCTHEPRILNNLPRFGCPLCFISAYNL